MTADHAERRILSSPDITALCSRHRPWPAQKDGGQAFMPSPNPEETRTSFRVWRRSPSHHQPGRGRLLSKYRDNNMPGLIQPTQLFLFFLLFNLFIYSNWRHTCVLWTPSHLPPYPTPPACHQVLKVGERFQRHFTPKKCSNGQRGIWKGSQDQYLSGKMQIKTTMIE